MKSGSMVGANPLDPHHGAAFGANCVHCWPCRSHSNQALDKEVGVRAIFTFLAWTQRLGNDK